MLEFHGLKASLGWFTACNLLQRVRACPYRIVTRLLSLPLESALPVGGCYADLS